MFTRAMNLRRPDLVLVLAVLALLQACAGRMPQPDPSASLHERLGGRQAIVAVVDEFVDNIAADERINKFFVNTDMAQFKGLLVEQFCEMSGGPCRYSGRTMRAAHAGMRITDAHFAAMVEDLEKALDTLAVPAREKSELLVLVDGMKNDIVR